MVLEIKGAEKIR